MNCPHCNVALLMTDRQGVEIDYCPQCRGVWLDRGELDKIIEREASFGSAPGPSAQPAPPFASERPRYNDDRRRYDDDDDDYRRYGQHGRRKRGWLGEIFDFD